jgi:predicted amidohydrolase
MAARKRGSVRAAAVQLNSTEYPDRNLPAAEDLVRAAVADGAQLVVLPERADVRGNNDDYARAAAGVDEHPTVQWAQRLARELHIDLIPGSFVEQRPGREKHSNTSVHVGPDGELKAIYRKIHLFDVEVAERQYLESDTQEPGEEIVVSELADGAGIGLTICYDLRFPELYRIQAIRGARVVTVPANFTRVTGEAHWEVLLRARAIENQSFVIAAAQFGEHPHDMGDTYGNTMIVDPWGRVLARLEERREGFVMVDLDFGAQDDLRAKLPSLANRVAGAYHWPQEAPV